ncbi:MAG: queuosine salvage family protein [Myxococcota bacterium]
MSEPSLFDEVRRAAARVAREARQVRIDDAALERFADALAADAAGLVAPALDPAHHFLGDDATTAAFVFAIDAINFGSGWFPLLAKRDGLSGYLTIASALRERFERAGAFSARELRALGAEDVGAMLGQLARDGAHPDAMELMALYARALRDLGEWLDRHFAGSALAAVEEADGCAESLVRRLAAMPLYRDVSRYAGRDGASFDVPLYKRAQITVSDLAAAFDGRGPGAFRDLDALTMFADNLVPHVLRCRGVLAYDAALARRIDAGDLLEAGAGEEVEIRAVGLHAVEGLVAALRARGVVATARALDGRLWTSGQDPAIKARPRHRARSVYY